MSSIRWVDLLSSESNFSRSIPNNYDNEKLKKKNIYTKENDLNNSFLNSYNGDLDNSNVGINLKIKNMCITDKKEKKKENFDFQTNANDDVNKEINNNEKGNVEKESKSNKEINNDQLLHKDGSMKDSKLDNKNYCEANDENNGKNVNSSHVDKINQDENEKMNKKKEKENKNKNKNYNFYSNKNSNNNSKNKSNSNSKLNSKLCKKKNSSNLSDYKVNKNKKIVNTPLDKKTVKNSFFSKYISEKKGNNKENYNKDYINSVTISKSEKENKAFEENTKKCNLISIVENKESDTITKCKKRKDRNLCIDNSISKYDYTQSQEVTLDENNVPLNPTKKMKNKLKEIKENIKDNKKNIKDYIIYNDLNEKNEMKKNFKKAERNNNMMGDINNIVNKNINFKKFNNFNNNFISYIGDIRNNLNETLNNVNSNRVSSRLKEIAVGKSTKEYKNYVKNVRYSERMEDDPLTPNAYENITNAKFQAKYNLWRKKLHKFDTLN